MGNIRLEILLNGDIELNDINGTAVNWITIACGHITKSHNNVHTVPKTQNKCLGEIASMLVDYIAKHNINQQPTIRSNPYSVIF